MKKSVCIENRLLTSLHLVLCAIALSITFAGAATLPPTNNLVMWLKADSLVLANGAGVTSWTDNSTNGNDAILNAAWDAGAIPKYYTNGINGRPAVGFGAPGSGGYGSAGNDALFISNHVAGTFQRVSLPSGLTFAAAFKTFDSVAGSGLPNAGSDLISDNTGLWAHGFGLNSGVGQFNRYDAISPGGVAHVTGSTVLNNTNTFQGHYLIATHRNDVGTANDLASLYADGSLQVATNVTYIAPGFDMIGQSHGTGGLAFRGLIGEVLVYNAELSGADLQQLNTYLTERWLDIPEPSAVLLLIIGGVLLRRKY